MTFCWITHNPGPGRTAAFRALPGQPAWVIQQNVRTNPKAGRLLDSTRQVVAASFRAARTGHVLLQGRPGAERMAPRDLSRSRPDPRRHDILLDHPQSGPGRTAAFRTRPTSPPRVIQQNVRTSPLAAIESVSNIEQECGLQTGEMAVNSLDSATTSVYSCDLPHSILVS